MSVSIGSVLVNVLELCQSILVIMCWPMLLWNIRILVQCYCVGISVLANVHVLELRQSVLVVHWPLLVLCQ